MTQLESIKVFIKNQENHKKHDNIRATPALLRNGSSNLPDLNKPQGPVCGQTFWHQSKIPKIVSATEKL